MRNLALLLLLLTGCTPLTVSILAPNPRAIPTSTSTPVPPLVAHEWNQNEPLITYVHGMGMMSQWASLLKFFPMDFTLLPSGDLYLHRRKANLSWEILTTRLSRQATCNLLNSIDQAGFFDYDPSSYLDPSGYLTAYPGSLHPGEVLMPGGTDGGFTRISVHAWRSNSVSLYNLYASLDEESGYQLRGTATPVFPTILPAIRTTFRLLDQYQSPSPLHVLKPGRLGVWLRGGPGTARTNDVIWWPLKSYTLAAAASTGRYGGGPPAMILTGEDATQVYDALGGILNGYGIFSVREGDKLYRVFARPLLPNEFNSSPLPKVSLRCSPSDGWIQVP